MAFIARDPIEASYGNGATLNTGRTLVQNRLVDRTGGLSPRGGKDCLKLKRSQAFHQARWITWLEITSLRLSCAQKLSREIGWG